jgi:hypothetical protein
LGSIPSSVNLPLSELKDALSPNFGEGDFKKVSLFSLHHPTQSSPIKVPYRPPMPAYRRTLLIAYRRTSPLLRRDSGWQPRNSHSTNPSLPKTSFSSVDPGKDPHQQLNKLVRMGMGMLGIIKEVGWIGKRERKRVGMITSLALLIENWWFDMQNLLYLLSCGFLVNPSGSSDELPR